MSAPPSIIVHGGVGESEKCPMLVERVSSCRKSACIGYDNLINGGSAIKAVEAALRWLEDDELFNCGYGSVLNEIGEVQMNSSIISGMTGESGSVVAVSGIDHPISLAKYVLQNAPNTIFCEKRATKPAENINGIIKVSKANLISPAAYATFMSSEAGDFGLQDLQDDYRLSSNLQDLITEHRSGAGCVAWDGIQLAVGSTSGGRARKRTGSLGGSAMPGSGLYADERFGCSLATGHGQSLMSLGLARHVAKLSRAGATADEALELGVERLSCASDGPAGAVALGSDGTWSMQTSGAPLPFCHVSESGFVCGSEPEACKES